MPRMSRNRMVLGFPIDKADFAKFKAEILPQLNEVQGALEEEEAYFLYKTARELKVQAWYPHIVEIGAFCGKSTVAMGLGLKENPQGDEITIHSIDPFNLGPGTGNRDNYPVFLENITKAGVEKYVKAYKKTSMDALPDWDPGNRIAFLWIDGAHEMEFVREDFQEWGRFLTTKGPGILAMHDTYFAGVHQVIKEDVLTNLGYRDFKLIRSLMTATKHDYAPRPEDLARKKRFELSLDNRREGAFASLRKAFGTWLRMKLSWLISY